MSASLQDTANYYAGNTNPYGANRTRSGFNGFMKYALSRAFKGAIARTIGTERAEKLLALIARRAGVDLLNAAHHDIGILHFQNFEVSGERYFLERYAAPAYRDKTPVIFDVGANIGDYSRLVLQCIPQAKLFSFEPSPATFQALSNNLNGTSARCVNLGMSSVTEQRSLFNYPGQPTSPHATLNREFIAFYNCADPVEIPCSFSTVDEFCDQAGVDRIDILKIDAEGHELEVLKGGRRMLQQNRIGWIHFEFGEGNVFSRVFLNDYYNILPGYRFFRVTPSGLIPLGNYSPRNEIFLFQNIAAAPPDVSISV